MNIVKDSILLLLTGIVCAGLAWVFWHFVGEHGVVIILLLGMAGLAADNRRLRRRLHDGPPG